MTIVRVLQILLAGLFLGLVPLRADAGDSPTFGGDGGVVILPFTAVQLGSNTAGSFVSQGNSGGNLVSVPLGEVVGFDVFRFKLPEEMVNAYAVILIPEYSIVLPARVVAGYIEIEVQMLRALADLGIDQLDVVAVSDSRLVLRFSIQFEETETVEKTKQTGNPKKAQRTKTADRG